MLNPLVNAAFAACHARSADTMTWSKAYDAVRITMAKIQSALESAGLRVVDVVAASDSPVRDSFQG